MSEFRVEEKIFSKARMNTHTSEIVAPSQAFKLIIVGDKGVGKTSYVRYLQTDEFEEKHVCTLGVEVHPVRYNHEVSYKRGAKNIRKVYPACFNTWDCAGDPRFGGLRDGYYIQADCALVMFDRSNASTFRSTPEWVDVPSLVDTMNDSHPEGNVVNWIKEVRNVASDIPIILVGTHWDKEEEVSSEEIEALLDSEWGSKNIQFYYNISINPEHLHNVDEPLSHLIHLLIAKKERRVV